MRWQKPSEEQAHEPVPSTSPLALVDDALRVATGRQLFTRDEALGLLRRVRAEVDDPAHAATVERIVADVDSGSSEQVMVSCTELVDPLLDIRLALCS
jgi:hypothetical protein